MRQLQQRVSVHCRLSALDLAGVAGYIAHRLRQAGGSPDRVKFSGDAVEAIYELSGGVPRIINRLCDRALRHGYARRAATIDREILEAANPFGSEEMRATPASVPVAPPVAVAPVAAAPPVAPPPPTSVSPALAMLAFPAESEVEPVAVTPVPPTGPAPLVASDPVIEAPPAPMPVTPPAAEPALRESARSFLSISEPGPVAARAPLPDRLESWLSEIEKQPEAEPVPLDWRERWAPTNAVAPEPERQSGVRFRIRSGSPSHQQTKTERLTRRFTRKMAALAVAVVVLLGALVLGPASIGASIDLWSEVVERFTPPQEPNLPPRPRVHLPAPLLLPPPPADDELQTLPSTSGD
jgi:hypothetical protein